MAIAVSAISYFVPIFAFLLVFVIVFALIKKTNIVGESDGISLLIAFIIAVFFILEASLVDFVRLSSSWLSVLIIGIFFLVAIVGFLPGAEPLKFLSEGKTFAWVVLALIVGIFIFSSVYVFHFAVSLEGAKGLLDSEYFGAVALIVIGIIAFIIITRKVK